MIPFFIKMDRLIRWKTTKNRIDNITHGEIEDE